MNDILAEIPTPKVQNAGDFGGARTFIVSTINKSVHITLHHHLFPSMLSIYNNTINKPGDF